MATKRIQFDLDAPLQNLLISLRDFCEYSTTNKFLKALLINYVVLVSEMKPASDWTQDQKDAWRDCKIFVEHNKGKPEAIFMRYGNILPPNIELKAVG